MHESEKMTHAFRSQEACMPSSSTDDMRNVGGREIMIHLLLSTRKGAKLMLFHVLIQIEKDINEQLSPEGLVRVSALTVRTT